MIPQISIGEIVSEVSRPVALEPGVPYRSVGVKWYGAGVHVHERREGHLFDADRFQIEQDDLIYNDMWARMGSVAIVPSELAGSVASSHFPTFRLNESKVIPPYLAWYFRTPSFWNDCENASRGSTGRNQIKRSTFCAIRVPLPPLDEQRRIVARVEELAAKVEEAKGLKRQAAGEAATLMGKHIADIFSLQQGGSWKLGTLGDYVTDDCYGTSEKTNDDARGTPILRMGNIQDGRLVNRSLKYLQIASKERAKLILQPGDILVNRTNSAELVGKCAVFDLDGDYGFASYIIRLRLDQARAHPRLVAAYINSPIGRAYMVDEKKQMTGQANVNATTLKKFPLPLPDLNTQKNIVAALDALQSKLDSVKALQAETAAELDAMLPAILDKAFKGEL